MTVTVNAFADFLGNLKEYVQEKQKQVEKLVASAFEGGYIDEITFRRLSAEEFIGRTFIEAFNHFTRVLSELVEIGQNNRLEKIVRGGEYIESITPDHPNWEKANARYTSLVDDYRELRQRIDGLLPFEPTREELEAEQ